MFPSDNNKETRAVLRVSLINIEHVLHKHKVTKCRNELCQLGLKGNMFEKEVGTEGYQYTFQKEVNRSH